MLTPNDVRDKARVCRATSHEAGANTLWLCLAIDVLEEIALAECIDRRSLAIAFVKATKKVSK